MVLLAGGTGGAKLARGMLDEVGSDLVVIANTGDDVEIHGGYVSPDPDLVLYWLADRIDERGWGMRDDTFHVMEALRELGELGERLVKGMVSMTQLGRLGQPDEVAAAIAFLASDEAAHITGASLPVDGGYTAA